MTTENLTTLTGNVADALEKGVIGKGEIMRITLGEAQDFMTEEQVQMRKVSPVMKFVEIEVIEVETSVLFTKSFRYYEGSVPANSVQGQLIRTYGDIQENSVINLMTKEVGKPGREYVVWDIVMA